MILKQVGVAGEIILRQTVLDGIVQWTKIAHLQKDHYWVSIYMLFTGLEVHIEKYFSKS